MRFLFWPGVIGLAPLEVGLVYFIMPLPVSQRMRSIELAYALYPGGTKSGGLTGTDTVAWNDTTWVVGIALNGAAKAYDWRQLRRERVINDVVGGVPIVLAPVRLDRAPLPFRTTAAAGTPAMKMPGM